MSRASYQTALPRTKILAGRTLRRLAHLSRPRIIPVPPSQASACHSGYISKTDAERVIGRVSRKFRPGRNLQLSTPPREYTKYKPCNNKYYEIFPGGAKWGAPEIRSLVPSVLGAHARFKAICSFVSRGIGAAGLEVWSSHD
jgi:hypothetical protein